MQGAIIGDIAGSIYEWKRIKTESFEPFLAPEAIFTDDSVLTVAVADALVNGRPPVESFKDWGRRYPDSGWGGRFHRWLFSAETEAYGSFGNGAAMRVSPAGLLGQTLDQALDLAHRVTEITHDHPEGLKGAAATAMAIFLARSGEGTQTIGQAVTRRFGYDLDRTVDRIRPGYRFNETCQGSVPEALACALEATDYEDAIRNAIRRIRTNDKQRTARCLVSGSVGRDAPRPGQVRRTRPPPYSAGDPGGEPGPVRQAPGSRG
jgi:ADP-ribosyl-[dinitrogen reductase] hydrolase